MSAALGTPVGTPVRVVRETGGFSSGLCDCCNDCCSCFAVCCCAPTVISQLVQRTIYRKRGTCVILAIVLWAGMVANLISGTSARGTATISYSYDDSTDSTDSSISTKTDASKSQMSGSFLLLNLLGLAGGLFGLAMCLLTCMVRRHIRRRDGIEAQLCSACDLDDCILSCCCLCCTQAQIMRHEGLVGGHYKLTATDGMLEML